MATDTTDRERRAVALLREVGNNERLLYSLRLWDLQLALQYIDRLEQLVAIGNTNQE